MTTDARGSFARKAMNVLLVLLAAAFVAAPVPGDDLGSCTTSSLRRADPSQHCKDRYRALCGKASECGLEYGAPCNEAAVSQACATAFWPEDCGDVAERDALHCIELLQDLSCDELEEPVKNTNLSFCEFCPEGAE